MVLGIKMFAYIIFAIVSIDGREVISKSVHKSQFGLFAACGACKAVYYVARFARNFTFAEIFTFSHVTGYSARSIQNIAIPAILSFTCIFRLR